MTGPISEVGNLPPLKPIDAPDGTWTLPGKSNLRPEAHLVAAKWAWSTYQGHVSCGNQCTEYRLSMQVLSRLNFPPPFEVTSKFPLPVPKSVETPDETKVAVE